MESKSVKHFVPFLLLLCLANVTADQTSSVKKHFVLVHGASHGAWCWYKLATLLNSTSHNITALDLPAAGINPMQVQQVHSFSDYVAPLSSFLGSLAKTERVILVGHSLGGAVISIAMERFPEKVTAAVYATSLMPGPALSYLTIIKKIMKRVGLPPSQPPTSPPAPKRLSSSFYQLSPPEDLRLALSMVRASPVFNGGAIPRPKDIKLTKERYGSIPRVYILCDQDLAVQEDIQTWMIRKNPPKEVR